MTDPSSAAERGNLNPGQAGPNLDQAVDSGERVRVWDPLVRFFHWGLAGAVLIAFLTEDELLGLHTWAGYAVLGLIAVRVLWERSAPGTRASRNSCADPVPPWPIWATSCAAIRPVISAITRQVRPWRSP